ncbi:methionine--tRNA ligase [Candidatus Saccharibacteria bacterium]|nr:methionine--tRNA ligase [Candidatus Saccharibacteria bacterium]
MKKYYITTAIPYANAAPHIGTAMDYLYGDILLRYKLSQDFNAKLSIGTDEHGTKVEQKARDNNMTPQEWTDQLQPEFQKMRAALNLDFGVSIDQIAKSLAEQDLTQQNIINVRTTDPTHVKNVQEIWRRLDRAGVIYKSTYEGWYCVGCEGFVTETEAREMNYTCGDHNKPLEKLSEDNYYLKVSQFTEQIREFAKTSVIPEFRGREILELIKDGAKDVSISRPVEKLKWGVPVPGDESQIMYVWIDALSNYITALNYPDASWQKDFWPADVEIVGKDILRFHAVIWPAMLLALGLDLPKKLMVHGFVNVGGSKMSKSIGNVVSPLEIIEQYGTDAFRYYFARHIPTFDDGDFTWEKLENAYNGELANDLGNLVSRVANMLKKYEISAPNPEVIFNEFDRKSEQEVHEKINQLFASYELNSALEFIWELVQNNNKFIEEKKPWTLAKTDRTSLENVLQKLWLNLVYLSELLAPFLPETSAKIQNIFAKDSGEKITENLPILFPKKYLHTEEPERK